MVMQTLSKVFGSKNDRELKRMGKVVARINSLEEEIEKLDDAAIKARKQEFRNRIEAGESLEDILPEAFATVREAGKGFCKCAYSMSS